MKKENFHLPVQNVPMEMMGSRRIRGILEGITFEIDDYIAEEDINEETLIDLITLKIDGRDVFIYPTFEKFKVSEIPPLLSFLNEGEKRFIVITLRKFGSNIIAFDFDLKNALISEVIENE